VEWPLPGTDGDLPRIAEQARTEGPQFITARDEPVAVVLSMEEYWQLRGKPADFRDWLLNGPKLDDETLMLLTQRLRGDIHDDEL
jgi:prevent-host-death family protein